MSQPIQNSPSSNSELPPTPTDFVPPSFLTAPEQFDLQEKEPQTVSKAEFEEKVNLLWKALGDSQREKYEMRAKMEKMTLQMMQMDRRMQEKEQRDAEFNKSLRKTLTRMNRKKEEQLQKMDAEIKKEFFMIQKKLDEKADKGKL
ncbi:Oidioi.mRNA.OKI2018_I69.PAR.g12536.t1.cds [Oikopleura dioica]|uniref:Oidioi.mRNA.OKI2018_I69.PAR.g12536.t1.cds n=1 Tax=Oikopleura dioica TaxID=34765 RepID=A0ABN7S859_OIKDI|nr:Oidioi.mRNA.OKI2018_I69.PAR.g12536.t1.cds [Oikopleura dioica]